MSAEPALLPEGAEKREVVRALFEGIAPRYDLLNRVLTLGMDQRWRRAAIRTLSIAPGARVLDLACGTGDFVGLAQQQGAAPLGLDFASAMLARASQLRAGAPFVLGDGAELPLADGVVDAVTCGFALRNFVSLAPVFAELARVLRPEGRIALLDVDRPSFGPARALHGIYFDKVVPRVGGMLSDRRAYAYLPRSTSYLPSEGELAALLRDAGFLRVRCRRYLFGTVQLWTGERGAPR